MTDIYDLKLHDEITLENRHSKRTSVTIMRVPGGWNYNYFLYTDNGTYQFTTQFVPWHDSGRMIENNGNYSELKAKLAKSEAALKKAELALFKIDAYKYQVEKIRETLQEYVRDKG